MANTYVLLGSNYLGSATSSITFSGISSSYKTLVLYCNARTDISLVYDSIRLRFNGDTGTNYCTSWGGISNTSYVYETTSNSLDYIQMYRGAAGNTQTSGNYGYSILYIGNVTSSKWKPSTGSGGNNANANSNQSVLYYTGAWKNTSSLITSINIFPASGNNFVAESSFYLYGISTS